MNGWQRLARITWSCAYKFQDWLRVAENAVMCWKRFRPVRVLNKQPYIRSHCALYRRSLLDRHELTYGDHPTLTAGQGLHHDLVKLGYECRILDPRDVIQRVVHLNHATELLLPELQANSRKMHLLRGQARLTRFFLRPETKAILEDSTLDQGPATIPQAA